MKKVLIFLFTIFSIISLASCDLMDYIDIKENNTENDNNTNDENNTDNSNNNLNENDTNKLTLSFTGYYSSLNGVLDNDFEKKLHQLTESKHTTKGSYKTAWTILQEADEDPNNSDNIICLYTGRSLPKSDRDGSSSSSVLWNREHVWPKSLGFSKESYPAHNDCHHLHATEKNINSTRGNKNFGEVDNPSGTDSYGNSWDSVYFEPRDSIKGDVARSIFYMVARYNGDVCDDCVLDLEIIDGVAEKQHSSDNLYGKIGDLNTLLKWHYEDPVDDFERNRNDIVYSYQGNRNPFIDHEEFVSYLYTSRVSSYVDITEIEYLI